MQMHFRNKTTFHRAHAPEDLRWRNGRKNWQEQEGAPPPRTATRDYQADSLVPPDGVSLVGAPKPPQRERQLWRNFSRSSGVIFSQRSSIRSRMRSPIRPRILEREP